MSVFVLDRRKQPLMPCSEKRSRLLLGRGRALVVRAYPFTIRLKDRTGGITQPVRIKIDPGSKTSGIAVVRESGQKQHVLVLMELAHRGRQISKSLEQRRAFRRRRRNQLRYRAPRFLNRLRSLVPVVSISQELVRFDTQKMENPEVSGVEYQQGTLLGYEVREYLLEKWGRECAYCTDKDTPLQIEHIDPKVNGGSSRISNLTLACRPCNQEKGRQPLADFFASSKRLKNHQARLDRILKQCKKPLRDASAVNSTRWALHQTLKQTGLPVEVGTGGRTKFNRRRLNIPKTHALDAACVGEVEIVEGWDVPTLAIKATGRGSYKRTRLTKHGFPRGYLMRQKQVQGFQTGDMVRAIVPTGTKAGTWLGRVAVRKTGSFNIQTSGGAIQGVSYRHCTLTQRADGYGYHIQPNQRKEEGDRENESR
ncbi:5-methylcytosine-specific restriction endonuclease McrA [Marinobacter sp. LV10R520-4]|uniref:RNA-guided endonuclease IscB n=1 Tax=Marinobacter sp. LV10R520-4 TaxID=1761796 RepID=UPI000BFA911D|nr:RNA-guided endonuclease IscB [Marinobacter sp. LV10R520-4]PFG52424.1 5-methylcytosine-specific restriction endonuclease McrA [Marinobacter sp. LV10R520-4]